MLKSKLGPELGSELDFGGRKTCLCQMRPGLDTANWAGQLVAAACCVGPMMSEAINW